MTSLLLMFSIVVVFLFHRIRRGCRPRGTGAKKVTKTQHKFKCTQETRCALGHRKLETHVIYKHPRAIYIDLNEESTQTTSIPALTRAMDRFVVVEAPPSPGARANPVEAATSLWHALAIFTLSSSLLLWLCACLAFSVLSLCYLCAIYGICSPETVFPS